MFKLKQFLLKKFFIRNANKLNRTVIVDRNTLLEGDNIVGKNSSIKGSNVGFKSYIGDNCRIDNTSIGKYSCISHNVVVVQGTHPISSFVSIHPCFYDSAFINSYVKQNKFDKFKYLDKNKKIACSIGNDVWIGFGALIMSGVSVGDGAVIGAGSVVTKNVEPYSIVAGVPARVIRYRFSQDIISKLLKIQWWNWDYSKISEQKNLFADIEKFISMNAK
jgi:acetyltransferase-like isoleucine patch superfamily enzyme